LRARAGLATKQNQVNKNKTKIKNNKVTLKSLKQELELIKAMA